MSNGKVGWHESRLADALYLAAELDEAGALYEQLLEKDPSWRVAYYGSLGAVAARKGDRATAEAYITALAGVDIPEEAEPYDVALARARIAALLGDAGRALAYLRAGYNGGQGVDLHADVDFEDVLAHNRAFQEFVRPKG